MSSLKREQFIVVVLLNGQTETSENDSIGVITKLHSKIQRWNTYWIYSHVSFQNAFLLVASTTRIAD